MDKEKLAEIEKRWTVEPRVVFELHPHETGMPSLTLPATVDRRASRDVQDLIAALREAWQAVHEMVEENNHTRRSFGERAAIATAEARRRRRLWARHTRRWPKPAGMSAER